MPDLPSLPDPLAAPAEASPFEIDDVLKDKPKRTFEDLTLAEALGLFLRRPGEALRGLRYTLTALPEDRRVVPLPGDLTDPDRRRIGRSTAPAEAFPTGMFDARPVLTAEQRMDLLRAGLLIAVLVVALIGSLMLQSDAVRRSDGTPLGAWVLLAASAGLAILTASSVFGRRPEPLPRLPDAVNSAVPTDSRPFARITGFAVLDRLLITNGVRVALFGIATLLSLATWTFTAFNEFTDFGLLAWGLSVLAWLGVFARQFDVRLWLRDRLAGLRRTVKGGIRLRPTPTAIALLAILLVGAWFRFNNLSFFPPDMTSDAVEKLLDAIKVLNGNRSVFFPNNGGRESFQMYTIAAFHTVTGFPLSFELLKVVTGIEGMLMILAAWWLGRAFFGEENRAFGNVAGLAMAALVAVSYWHTMLSRLGLRIVLTPLITTVVLIFLVRAIRHNRRTDFLICGLVLGAGMYFYQAARMLPVLVIAGIVLAMLFRARTWRATRVYLINSIALVIVALAVFVPLGRYWYDFPASFWERTGGRFFGEDLVDVKDAAGNVIGQRLATTEDRMEAFRTNLPVFFDNYRKSLFMFNVRGDNAWITGDPDGTPQLDTFTGTLFVLGAGLSLVWAFRRRDPAYLLLLIGILIMLLPTALSIAFVIEVPSATRASGSLPMVYLLAGAALAFVLFTLSRLVPSRRFRYILVGIAVVGILFGGAANAHSYFVDAAADYRISTFPYRQAGEILGGFARSTGAPGNAFMISWNYWWDWRALGIEGGYPNWPNGILREQAFDRILNYITFNLGTEYEIRPDRQLLFFLHPLDSETLATLRDKFPGGTVIQVPTFEAERDFTLYVAPPVDCDWLQANIGRQPAGCQNGFGPRLPPPGN